MDKELTATKEKEIEKPITLVREDLINNIIKLIEDSGLSVFLVEPILKDLLNDVHSAMRAQTESDRVRYERAIASAKDKVTSKH